MGSIFVLGEKKEAVLAVREAPTTKQLDFLRQHARRQFEVIAQCNPDAIMTRVLSIVDQYRAIGNDFITNPQSSLEMIFASFTNGHNEYAASQSKTVSAPLNFQDVLKKWQDAGSNTKEIEGLKLSQGMSESLQGMVIGIIPPELQQAILGAVDRYDVNQWEALVMVAFTDGWNAARQKIGEVK